MIISFMNERLVGNNLYGIADFPDCPTKLPLGRTELSSLDRHIPFDFRRNRSIAVMREQQGIILHLTPAG